MDTHLRPHNQAGRIYRRSCSKQGTQDLAPFAQRGPTAGIRVQKKAWNFNGVQVFRILCALHREFAILRNIAPNPEGKSSAEVQIINDRPQDLAVDG